MIRGLLRFIFLLLLLVAARSVIMSIWKAVSQAMKPDLPPHQTVRTTPSAGELKKDPVCGTFVAVATSLKKTVNGEIVYFCSASCRDKYKAA